jgi:hypothetical protein
MAEASPKNVTRAQDAIIKELSFFGSPDVTADENGELTYSFTAIKREKDATHIYRDSMNGGASGLGEVVFTA